MAIVGRARLYRLLVFGLAVFLAAISFSCKSSPTGPHITPQDVQLSSVYAACTEVWLKIGFSDSPNGGQYRITRDSTDTVLTGSFTASDTVVIDTTTQAEKSYTYKAYKLVNGKVSGLSLSLKVTTMDSTSNNFTWQMFLFSGKAGSSILQDVAIISDTDIWAMGTIAPDSLDQEMYNAIHWNGSSWQSIRIYFYTFCGQSNMGSYPTHAVLAFSQSDIWIAGAGQVTRWNGYSQSVPICDGSPSPFDIYKLWGNDSSSVYAVGYSGNVASYFNGLWHQLVSSTSLGVHDVWGVSNVISGEEQVLAVASDQFTNNGVAVLQLSRTQASMIQTTGIPTTSIMGVWSADGREWYVCGDGLYKTRNLSFGRKRITNVPLIYKEAIRGNGPNDIYVVGDFGLIMHFNGSTWFDCSQQVNLPNSVFYGVGVKGNTVVAVGQTVSGSVGGAALILVGNRN